MPEPQEPREGEDEAAGDHEGVPAELVELHEVVEWERTVAGGEGHPR